MNKRWTTTLAMLTLTLSVGCVGDVGIDGNAQWLCTTTADLVICESARDEAEPFGDMFYACMPGDVDRACPSDIAVEDLRSQLVERIGDDVGVDRFLETTPFACLLTGESQRECLLELVDLEREPTLDNEDEDNGDDEEGDIPPGQPVPPSEEGVEPSGGDLQQPVPPADCDVHAWQLWFADHATYTFQSAGIDISFPDEIFDPVASGPPMLDFSLSGRDAADGPSCGDAEWEMRQRAWPTLLRGRCTMLSDPLLAWCQQAANYAPTTGQCSASGTW